MFKIIICVLALTTNIISTEIRFDAQGSSIVFHANWHPNIRQLSKQFSIFNKNLEKKDIQVIDISFAYCSDHQYLVQNLFLNKLNAKEISINLDSCQIGDTGLQSILSKIEEGGVQTLKLGLNSAGITDKGIAKLGKALSQLHLKRITVDLVYNKLGDKGSENLLINTLSKELEQLSLDLVFNKLTSKSLVNLPTFLKNVESERLKKLTLKLGSNKIQEKGAQILLQSLKRFNNLQQIILDLYFNNIKAKGAKQISEIIQLQNKLKSLSLNFDLNYIQTQGGIAIGNALKNLKNLQKLQIDVTNKNFGFNGFQAIVSEIEYLTSLKSLILKAGVNRVGLKGASKLAQAIEKLNLQYLELGFNENFISDEGTQIISQALSKQKSIKNIKLNLGFNQARGYGPISLLKTLEAGQYESIWLGLSNNPLEDKQVQLLIPVFQNLVKNTKRFELQFLNTKITRSLAVQIRQIFNEASKNSQEVIVHVDCVEQTQRVRDELQQHNSQSKITKGKSEQL